jgi:hypothetical protein
MHSGSLRAQSSAVALSPAAASTQELTRDGFRWSRSELQLQQDVQELNRVLCDWLERRMQRSVLERADGASASKPQPATDSTSASDSNAAPSAAAVSSSSATPSAAAPSAQSLPPNADLTSIPALFEGSLASDLRCAHVPYRSIRTEPFQDISLEVRRDPQNALQSSSSSASSAAALSTSSAVAGAGSGAAVSASTVATETSLHEALNAFVRSEWLDGFKPTKELGIQVTPNASISLTFL